MYTLQSLSNTYIYIYIYGYKIQNCGIILYARSISKYLPA